jgi:hypothetical protein
MLPDIPPLRLDDGPTLRGEAAERENELLDRGDLDGMLVGQAIDQCDSVAAAGTRPPL